MKPYQFMGYAMLQTTAITAVVSTRVTHGMKPDATLPAINYYEMPGGRRNGVGSYPFSVNCRATSAAAARNLAETVIDLFHGSGGTGMYGVMNGFNAARISLQNDNGLIPEPETDAYNAPVDILLTYSVDTVS